MSGVTVSGGYHTPPLLTETNTPALETSNGFGPIPMLEVSSFQISYTVENCGYGMPLLEGTYDQSDSPAVNITREQAGTPGISGTFDLSFNGREIRRLAAEVPASQLDQILEANFPNEGGKHYIPSP